jgi:hypothetical protein
VNRFGSFFQNLKYHKNYANVLELVIILIWAFWVGHPFLNLDPNQLLGRGNNDNFPLSVYPYFPLTRLFTCGDCVMWNGLFNGGSPTFGDATGAFFHPLMAPFILLFGVVTGVKIALLAALVMGGIALWWLAKVLKLSFVPRMWGAMLGVIGGNLAGPLYSGAVGIVFSVAASGLVIAPALTLALHGRRRDAIVLGVILAQAFLSGQGFLQLILLICLLPLCLIFMVNNAYKLMPIWKEFCIAAAVGVCISAVFWLPSLSMVWIISKPAQILINQPLEYLPLNLVIRDMNFFLSDVLHKLTYPELYINYIGWLPIILAILAWRLIPRESIRIYLFFTTTIILIFILGSTFIPVNITSWLDRLTTTPVNPVFWVGLAAIMILGLGAWGLDLLLKLNWPRFELLIGKNKSVYSLDSRVLIFPALIWSLLAVYNFNAQFRTTVPMADDIILAAESISPNPAGWVQPIDEDWAFVIAAAKHNIKLTGVTRNWDLLDRPYPTMSISASLDPGMINDSRYSRSIANINFSLYPENHYAFIDLGSDLVSPCSASADGGHIEVFCQSDQAGTLYVQENALPGWNAWLDNKKVGIIPGQWLAVSAPAGTHAYKFQYLPWDVPLSILVSMLGLGLAGWLWFIAVSKSSQIPD